MTGARQNSSRKFENVATLPDRRQRRDAARRPSARRDQGAAAPLVHWTAGYRPQDSAEYDQAISMVWKQRHAGELDDAEAAERDVALRRQRYALGEGREAWA